MWNTNLITVGNERAKQVSHSVGGSGGGESAPRKFCWLEPSQGFHIAVLVLEKDQSQRLWQSKLIATAKHKQRLRLNKQLISSVGRDRSVRLYLSIIESDYVLSELRSAVSGGAACPQWGVLGRKVVLGENKEERVSHFLARYSQDRCILKLLKFPWKYFMEN